MPSDSWNTQQLAEFLALVSSFEDTDSALRGGVEGAAEAFDAEIAALVGPDGVQASVGFPAGEEPPEPLREAACEGEGTIELPGIGACEFLSVPLGEDDETRLMVARIVETGFDRGGAALLRGMGRVLALSLTTIRLLAEERELRSESERMNREREELVSSLRERQVLLERLSKLQRSIASRVALSEVFESIVHGARELLGDETVGLRLRVPGAPDEMEMVASVGVDDRLLPAMRRTSIGVGAGGRAIAEGRMIAVEDYAESEEMVPVMRKDGIRSALAAPILQRGQVVGSLVVATHRSRRYSESEREALLAFAEHAGLALNDAKAAEETAHQAFHDPLTGLPNRALFLDRLAVAQTRALRDGRQVAVLFADLDGFKTVNDSLGHSSGDDLLRAVGERLSEILRPTDTVARFGGDEFAVLVEQVADPIDGVRSARRVLDTLERPFELRDREVFVTASVGIAIGRDEPEELLRRADLAMYEAKGQGKGRYELFQHEMHRQMAERLALEQDLKRATDVGEFLLHYQPIVDLASGSIVAVEALVRWLHPDRGLIAPNDFIPLAEESGQIHALGRWVLREACAQAARWQREHGRLGIAVNISGVQLRQPGLVREVDEALEGAGLDAEDLTLEITETVLMDATASNVERLTALKEMGAQIAIDDYGTGYSSLQYLRRFPVDSLKIAKPFVDGIGGSEDEAGLARAIADLAGSLRLGVVAEGIESASQARRLLELGCRRGQGFYYSPPLPADEIGVALEETAAPVAPLRAVGGD